MLNALRSPETFMEQLQIMQRMRKRRMAMDATTYHAVLATAALRTDIEDVRDLLDDLKEARKKKGSCFLQGISLHIKLKICLK